MERATRGVNLNNTHHAGAVGDSYAYLCSSTPIENFLQFLFSCSSVEALEMPHTTVWLFASMSQCHDLRRGGIIPRRGLPCSPGRRRPAAAPVHSKPLA